ncbi:HU family DNA-binding protein [Dermacoccaceae bacterium W4C1]
MNRTDLASTIAQKTGVSVKDANTVIGGLNDVILEAVARGEKIQLPGLLTIEVVDRAARTGRNPQTGAEIQIAASKAAKVTAGSKLKAAAKG